MVVSIDSAKKLMGSLTLDGQLTKGFRAFLKDLDAASQR